MTAILADLKTSGIVYAGTAANGVFRSSDGGATWQARSQGLPDLNIPALAAGPASLYAGTDHSGLFTSRDGGVSWSRLPGGADFVAARIPSVAADPAHAGTLIAVVDEEVLGRQLLRTTDDGRHWSRLALFASLSPEIVVADGGATGTFYAASPRGRGIYRSTNSGASWTPVGPSQVGPVSALTVDPVTHTVYVGYSDRSVLSSTNRGGSWRLAPSWPAGYGAKALAARAGLAYAGAVTFDQLHPPVQGFFMSTDGGTTWHAGQQGLGTAAIKALAVDPRKPRTAYAGADAWASSRAPMPPLTGSWRAAVCAVWELLRSPSIRAIPARCGPAPAAPGSGRP